MPQDTEPPAKQAFLRAYKRPLLVASDPFSFAIGRMELVCLIAAVQLACWHPRFTGPSRKVAEDIVRQLAAWGFQDFPATKAVVDRGWDVAYDGLVNPEEK